MKAHNKTKAPRPKRFYPWTKWLSTSKRSALKLTRGIDFDVSPSSMIAILRTKATKEGLRVSIHTDRSNTDVLTVRFLES